LAVIPARGGSKGLPRKNIRLFCEKPLILWTIQQAKESKYIDWITVTTDDKEIIDISKDSADEVIVRPASLAKDTSSTIDAVIHLLKMVNNTESPLYENFILLQPTSPLRSSFDIDSSIEKFFQCDSESLISVCSENIYWSFRQNKKYLVPVFGWKLLKKRRQQLPAVYKPNGAIYIMKTESFLRKKTFFTEKTVSYIMPQKRSIDIDDEYDFRYAEFLYNSINECPNLLE